MYYRGCLPYFVLLLCVLTTPFAAPGSPLQPPRRLRLPPLWLPQNKHNYPHFSADADASQGNSAKVRERLLYEKQFKDPLSEVNVWGWVPRVMGQKWIILKVYNNDNLGNWRGWETLCEGGTCIESIYYEIPTIIVFRTVITSNRTFY